MLTETLKQAALFHYPIYRGADGTQGSKVAYSGHVFGRGPGLPACKPGARPHHPLLCSLHHGLFFGTFIEWHLLSVFLELSPFLVSVCRRSQDGPCPSSPSSVSEVQTVDGFVLTSGHVITSFQGVEEPPAKPWTGLLKAQEESPEVSGGPRGAAKPMPTAPDAPESFPHHPAGPPGHGAVLPMPQMGRPGRRGSARPAASSFLLHFYFLTRQHQKQILAF